MKKKAVVLALAMSLAASIVGCSGKKETEKATEAKTEAKAETEAKTEAKATEAEKAVDEAISEVAAEVQEAATEAAEAAGGVAEAISEAAEDAQGAVEEAISEAAEAAGDVVEAVSEAAADVEENVEEAVSEAAEAAGEVVEAVSEAAADAQDTVEEAVSEAAEAVDTVEEAASEAAADAQDAVEEATSEAAEAAEAVVDAVEEAATEAADAAEAVVDAVEEAATEATDAAEAVVDAAEEAASEAADAAEAVVDAAEEAATEATDAAAAVAGAAAAAATALEDIEIPAREKPYVAAVLVPGTLGDKSFWDSANEGLTALKEELGADMFDFEVQEMGEGADDMASYPDFFLDAAESGKYDVIITGSWTAVDALNEAMKEFPDQKFILFDEEYDFSNGGENLYNVLFKQNEVSYLVGACASLLSETGTICFLGGMEGNVINDFLVGYIEGAKAVREDAKVAVSFVGNYSDSAKGKDLSLAMFNAGADVGYNVAGGAGMGILEAAKEAGKLAFGVDSDQAGLNPDLAPYIPTSALKNVGAGLARAIKLDMAGQLTYGSAETLGFAENGVELLDDAHYQEMVPEEIRTQVAELQEKITSGEIVVDSAKAMTAEEIDALKASVSVG